LENGRRTERFIAAHPSDEILGSVSASRQI
jgi:hypothetical protein